MMATVKPIKMTPTILRPTMGFHEYITLVVQNRLVWWLADQMNSKNQEILVCHWSLCTNSTSGSSTLFVRVHKLLSIIRASLLLGMVIELSRIVEWVITKNSFWGISCLYLSVFSLDFVAFCMHYFLFGFRFLRLLDLQIPQHRGEANLFLNLHLLRTRNFHGRS